MKVFLLSFSGFFCAICNAQTIPDIDNNSYDTLRIGMQTWLAKNLKTTRFNDGTLIQKITSQTEWAATQTPAFCWYNNDEASNKQHYGGLYNGFAVKTNKLCPAGWRVPSSDDWSTLINYLGGYEIAGGKLKEAGTAHWMNPNNGASNDVGFTALPGGYRPEDNFYGLNTVGFWWTSTENEPNYSWSESIVHPEIGMNAVAAQYHGTGLSVRCIKNNGCSTNDGIDIVETCDPYVWLDGNTYSSNNSTATFKLKNKMGCDSVVHLNLTINTAEANLVINGNIITTTLAGESYAWFNCDTDEYIANATNQNFEPLVSGSFGVDVVNNGCKKTSSCLSMIITKIVEVDKTMTVYPNPAKDFIRILTMTNDDKLITIIDALGGEVSRFNSVDNEIEIDIRSFVPSLYIIKVQSQLTTNGFKFLKN